MIELLYEALDKEIGIKVATDNVERLRQKLYQFRRENPIFEHLLFIVSPTNSNGELWIVKRHGDSLIRGSSKRTAQSRGRGYGTSTDVLPERVCIRRRPATCPPVR